MNVDKELLAKKIKEMEESLQEMKEELNKPKFNNQRVGSFGFVPKAGTGEDYYSLRASSYSTSSSYGLLSSMIMTSADQVQENYKGLFWKTEEEANSFADAMNVFLELRTMKGVTPFRLRKNNHCLELNHYGEIEVVYYDSNLQFGQIYFETAAYALKAIGVIGEERLVKALHVLSGTKT